MMNKRRFANFNLVFYILAAVVILALFAVSFSREEGDAPLREFEKQWYRNPEMTLAADLKHPKLDENRQADFYAVVPDDIQKGDCIWFKCKNAFIVVRVDGEVRAELKEGMLAALYGDTAGTSWVCVPLETTDIFKTISIEFRTRYNDGSAYIDSLGVGPAVSAVRYTMSGRVLGASFCLLLMFLSVLLIIVSGVFSRYIKGMPKEFLYLGLAGFFAAIWSFAELRVIQVFTAKNAGVVHNLSCMSLMMIAMPLVYYYKDVLDQKNKYIVPAAGVSSILNFLVTCTLHFTGIADFHKTLFITHIVIGVAALCILYANYLLLFKNPEKDKKDIPPAVCMMLLAVAAIVDMIRYRSGAIQDSAFFTRLAMFMVVVALCVRSLGYVVDMMRQGMKTDIVSRLAYEDGLTGLGNRTAYIEKIDEIRNRETSLISGKETTIFVFDINNLKYVNDNIGHLVGDEMIKYGAGVIEKVFGKIGDCYRTGGDEFVCLANGELQGKKYADEFHSEIREFNRKGLLDFPLVIALGYEVFSGLGDIQDAINRADHKMYDNKAELKKNGNHAKRV